MPVYTYKDIAKLLLDAKADINAQDNKGKTALMYAEALGHKEIAELLRAANAQNSKCTIS